MSVVRGCKRKGVGEDEGGARRGGATRRTSPSENRIERRISGKKRPYFVFLGHPSWSPRIFIALAAGKNMFYLYFIFFSFFFAYSPWSTVRDERGRLSWIHTRWPRNMKSRYGIPPWVSFPRRNPPATVLYPVCIASATLFSSRLKLLFPGWKYFGSVSMMCIYVR